MIVSAPLVGLPILYFLEGFATTAFLLVVLLPRAGFAVGADGLNPLVLAGAAGLAWAAFRLRRLRRRLTSVQSVGTEVVPTTPLQHSGIDVRSLERLSAALLALGFTPLIDYAAVRTPNERYDDFWRLFHDAATHTYTVIHQSIANGRPVTSMVVSFVTLFQRGWSFSTTTRSLGRRGAIVYALRLPKRLWQVTTGASIAEALGRHLSAVGPIAARHGLILENKDLIDAFLAYRQSHREELVAMCRHVKLMRVLFDMDRYRWKPKREWLGGAV